MIFTPGHTPSHICLYLDKSNTLVAGDALVITDGVLHGPSPRATYNMDTALQSVKKLTQFNIETAVCYHGGVNRDSANERLAQLANAAD